MNGKLRGRLESIETELARLARAAESHPTAEDLQKVHTEVKAVREEVAGSAKATRTSLDSVTSAVKGAFAKAAELAGTTPAPADAPSPAPAKKPANGKAAATPTAAAPAASATPSGKATP